MSETIDELREALRRAREEIQHHESFLAVVAHELRNPISPVLISVDALIMELSDHELDRETLLQRLQATQRYVDRLRANLDRLLDFSRIRSGEIELRLEPVDLSVVVADQLGGMAPLLAAAHCELRTRLTTPLRGRWDAMRLGQVVWNLVSNATKYAAGAPIDVTTSGTETHATLVVADHGPGIAEQERELVFRKFERTGLRSHTGFGVGLWLVRRIVEALGGTIELASTVGVGTTFTITLPRSTS